MYRNHTVGVVIPAYNEEAFVGDVVRDLPEFVDATYLVDDASTDATWREIGEAMRERTGRENATPRTRSGLIKRASGSLEDRVAKSETLDGMTRLRHRENRGAGGAIKTGYLAALEDGADVVATVDADGQMDVDRLPDVLDPVVTGRAGYAKGNRFADRNVVREMPPFRLFGNTLLTGLTRVASGYWGLSDPQNGFTAVSRDALLAIDVENLWEYYGYMNQLMAQLNAAGVRIADVSMPAAYGDEESGIDYPRYIRRVSGLLLVSFLRRLRTKYADRGLHPVPVFYSVGILAGVGSVLRWLLSRGSDRGGGSQRAAARGFGQSVAAFAVAVALDVVAGPVVVKEEPPGDSERSRSTRVRHRAGDGQ